MYCSHLLTEELVARQQPRLIGALLGVGTYWELYFHNSWGAKGG